MKRKVPIMLLIMCFITSCNNDMVDENKGWNIEKESFFVNDSLFHVLNKECKVILLYGQSNATGYTSNWYLDANDPDLYDLYKEGFDNVKINYVIEGNSLLTNHEFVDLKLENTNVGATFGPEMGIAEQYSNIYPNDDIFIIKYTWGGSSLKNEWLTSNTNRNIMYSNAINFTCSSLDYLITVGYKIHIEGICWMQGEADSFEQMCESYYDNTSKLVSYFRSDLKKYQSTINFIDAYIEDIDVWPMYKEINKQKYDFSTSGENNYLIDTISLGLTTNEEPWDGVDIYHYDSLSMVKLGREFAKTMINNQK